MLWKRLRTYFIILLISLFCLEGGAFVIIWWLSKDPRNDHLVQAVNKFHPLLKSRPKAAGNPDPLTRLRNVNSTYTFSPLMGYFHRRNIEYADNPLLTTGPDRFICNENCLPIKMPKPDDEVRIFILGGSSVAGTGNYPGTETISGHMERIINETAMYGAKRVRVINGGVGGWFSAQQLSRLVHEVAFLSPDVVVFLDGNNDVSQWKYVNLYPYMPKIGEHILNWGQYEHHVAGGFETVQTPVGATLQALNIINQKFPFFFYSGALAKHVRVLSTRRTKVKPSSNASVETNQQSYIFDDLKTNSAATYLNNWKTAAAYVEGSGIKGLFCLQPSLGFLNIDGTPKKLLLSPAENKVFARNSPTPPDTETIYTKYFQFVQNKLQTEEFSGSKNVSYCDLTDLFNAEGREIYPTDKIHYNSFGNELIARALIEKLGLLVGNY